MRKKSCLHVVLEVRTQQEATAERALQHTLRQIAQCEMAIEDLWSKYRSHQKQCVHEDGGLSLACEHRQAEAFYVAVVKQISELRVRLGELEKIRVSQMASYLSAHQTTQVIKEMVSRREKAEAAVRSMREEKRDEELFLLRRLSISNMSEEIDIERQQKCYSGVRKRTDDDRSVDAHVEAYRS